MAKSKLTGEQRARFQTLIDNILLFCGYKQMEVEAMGVFASEVCTIFAMCENIPMKDPCIEDEMGRMLGIFIATILAGSAPGFGILVKKGNAAPDGSEQMYRTAEEALAAMTMPDAYRRPSNKKRRLN